MTELHRRILVLGATSDVGAACAHALSARGIEIVLHGRSSDALTGLARTLPGTPACLEADVTDDGAVAELFERCSAYGPLDGMVYAVGLHRLAPLRVLSSASADDSFHANVTGFIQCTRAFAKLKNASRRSIVAVASIAAHRTEAGAIAYAAAKAALLAAARGAALELAPLGIRINTVSPGWLEGRSANAMTSRLGAEAVAEIRSAYPLGFGLPADVANAVAFLLSPEARWITGTDVLVDGGRSLR